MNEVEVKRIEKGPLWPLPADYVELGSEGRRQARVNAVRQYLLPGADGKVFAGCIDFFDRYYLWPQAEDIEGLESLPDHQAGHQPMFYDDVPCEPAAWHHALQRNYWDYVYSIVVCPRGAGKSYNIRKRIVMRAMAETQFSVSYLTNTRANVGRTAQVLRTQFASNERLINDFGPEYEDMGMGGNHPLVPSQKQSSFSQTYMTLRNGFTMTLTSVNSGQRGGRFKSIELDDPEEDARDTTDMVRVREHLLTLIYKKMLPMLPPKDGRFTWTGTFLSRQNLLWRAMSVEEADIAGSEEDVRFHEWARSLVRMVDENERSTWPQRFPTNDEERKAQGLHPRYRTLQDIKRSVGVAVWQSEYMGKPGGEGSGYFGLDRTRNEDRRRWGYWFVDADALTLSDPKRSGAEVVWVTKGEERMPWAELVGRLRPFITIDTSYTSGPASDYKAVHVAAFTPNKELMSLDLWAGKCDENMLIRKVFEMAKRWDVKAVWPEVVGRQQQLARTLQMAVADRLFDSSVQFIVKPLRVGQESKTSKIASLRLLFDVDRIKLPWSRKEEPAYRMLFDQLEQFSPEVQDGGLKNDDVLDTLAMAMLTSKMAARSAQKEIEEERMSEMERIKRGETYDEDGNRLVELVPFHVLRSDPEAWEAATASASKSRKKKEVKI